MREPNRERKGEIKYNVQLNDEQKDAKRLIRENQIVLITGRAGCLGKGTKILMFDNTFKNVEDIIVGDKLMGVDSTPRTVLNLKQGVEQMYWVRQTKGLDYRVNESHILSLRKNISARYHRVTINNKRYLDYTTNPICNKTYQIINMPLMDYINKFSKDEQYKGYISNLIKYEKKSLSIDPYFLGLWLGDGSSNNCGITTKDNEIKEFITKYYKSLNLNIRITSRPNNKAKTYTPSSITSINDDLFNKINILYNALDKNLSNVKKSILINNELSINVNRTTIINYVNKFKKLPLSEQNEILNKSTIEKDSLISNKLLIEFKKYNLINNKHIPNEFLINSIENRLQLLAGLIDSDGYYSKLGKYYEITQKNKVLADNIVFLCRSLGFKTIIVEKIAKMKRLDNSTYECLVYRITILPIDLIPPVKLDYKKLQQFSNFKDRKCTGIKVEKDVVDNYYGFELDGDNLFLLEDFTVTHNSGKSLVAAQTALDYLNKKEIDQILVTRATVEVGDSLGFLPGAINDKMNPYLEAFVDNLNTCMDHLKIEEYIKDGKIKGTPIQFIRGKTINDILVVEEIQNITKTQILAILTRLGKTGKIILNGDNEQMDINTHGEINGLSYVIELSKRLNEIKHIKLKENHRSDLVGKILDYEHSNKN